MWTVIQTCQPLRILRNHYAFRVSNTPLRKPVQNVGKLRILRNFGAIRPKPRNLQQLSWLAVNRKLPAGQNIDKDLFILLLPSHRRQIWPSDQQRKLQRWSHAQWNVVLIVNRSNAGGSSPTLSPASPVYRSENTNEDSVNVTIRHTVNKYMHIYDQCNFWATILPSTCVIISGLLSVSCATIARKNLISWCKQRDFFSHRVGARFMSISKRFYQHSGTIYRGSKSYLVVRISFDTVAENYGQVCHQFAMTACVLPLRPLAMLWHARGPEAATHDSWPAPQCCWNRIDRLTFGHHLSTSIHCSCRLRQWYTVKSNNKP